MKYTITMSESTELRTDCLVVGLFSGNKLTRSATAIDRATGGLLKRLIQQGDLEGSLGQTLLVPGGNTLPALRFLVVGLGRADQLNRTGFSTIVKSAAKFLQNTGTKIAVVTLAEVKVGKLELSERIRMIIEGFSDTDYRFDQLKSKQNVVSKNHLVKVILALPKGSSMATAQRSVHESTAIANGARLARDLANLPGNICTPSYLAGHARKLQRSHGLTVSVLDQAQMKKLKMGSLLSVAKGSRQPPKLIIMKYHGGAKNSRPIVLVGKGLTFDAGGISLKPASSMDEMKYDMCGGASVFGAMLATAELKLPLDVIGIVPSCENLPDGAANKPGDVVTSMSGLTIEILNTDAEGRLILCDALTYARRFKPDTIIDIATLTGACVVALGSHASGLFSTSDKLAGELLTAGEKSGDRAWRLPVWNEYQKQLKSPFADIANIGGRTAGAITAACFLARFTENLDWAHLDIAGTAWRTGSNKGATGRPVGLLTRFLIQRAETARYPSR